MTIGMSISLSNTWTTSGGTKIVELGGLGDVPSSRNDYIWLRRFWLEIRQKMFDTIPNTFFISLSNT